MPAAAQIATTRPVWVERLDELHLLTPLRVALVVVVAIGATIFVRRLVKKALDSLFERTAPADRPRAEARHKALSSALRAAMIGVIWAVTVITVISEIGVNIGGFVATATVVGGAIAFGAQTLIRDIISGFFVLADDQFGVGDEVDLGHAAGTVERVTLRTARLRDGEGRVWYVPHGNVARVGNLSKASVAVIDVEIARSQPIDEAESAVRRVNEALVADEHIAPMLIESPALLGITNVTDERYVVRVTVATTPSNREAVRRAWRRALLVAFASGELTQPTPAPLTLATLPADHGLGPVEHDS